MEAVRASGGLLVAAVAEGSLQWGLVVVDRRSSRRRKLCVQGNLYPGALARGCNKNSSPSSFPPVLRRACSSLSMRRRIHAGGVENTGDLGNSNTRLDMDLGSSTYTDCAEREMGEEGLQLPQEGYIGLFVRMLGMDNPVEDREEAVKALWRHSMGGKKCIDQIVAFPGILTLLVSLLPSSRSASCEAAAGLLRNISLSDAHRSAIAEVGAVEEIIGILTRRALSQQVREQAAGCLWILSLEEPVRNKIDISELLPVLFAMLDSEGADKESAAGILANFSLNECNYDLLVEAGIIPKLANLIKSGEGSKIARQEARKTLLELARKDQYKQIIIEEGLVPVPLIGASAYQSFKPLLDVVPSFPKGMNLEPSPSLPSTFGAGNLLLGLNVKNNAYNLDDATQLVIEGRARQHFLGRIGLLEKEASKQEVACVNKRANMTIMPWWDGIPRLVLILGLEDISVATLAASTISEIAVNEEIRQAIQKAGSVPHLVRLLGSGSESATQATACALERLAISFEVRKSIEAHGAVPALVEVLKAHDAPGFVKEKVLTALHRLSQTGEEVQVMIESGAYPGLVNIAQSKSANVYAKEEAEGILEELSSRKADSRDKIVDTNGVPALVGIFSSGTPSLKEKAARVMENLAVREQHAESIVHAGVEIPLKSLLEVMLEGKGDALDTQDVIEREMTWAAIAAASRLLNKLLVYEKVRASIDCRSLALPLASVLKSDIPLHVKDWVSACLLNLDRLVGITTNVNIPIESEVTIHDKIPRLVDEIGTSLDPDVQERAVIQLHDLVSQGIEGYVAAISNAGGIFPLVELLDKGTPKAREASLSVLYNIGTNEENHPALIRAGAVTYLQRIIRSENPQWMLALYLLRVLPT